MSKNEKLLVNILMENLRKNVVMYLTMNDNYFQDIKYAAIELENNNTMEFFEEFNVALLDLNISLINDINKLPYYYDLRDNN